MNNYRDELSEIILRFRTELTDYEEKFLIPSMRDRLKSLRKLFSEIVSICDKSRSSDIFSSAIEESMMKSDRTIIGEGDAPTISEQFFDSIKEQTQTENISDIDRIEKKYSKIENINELISYLNEVQYLCTSLIAVKEHLFTYRFVVYPRNYDSDGNEITVGKPEQHNIITEPFLATVDNIVFISKTTSETIKNWADEIQKQKTNFLELSIKKEEIQNNKLILFIQIGTVVLAIALSAFFLFSSDPLNLYKENRELKEKLNSLKQNIQTSSEDNIIKSVEQDTRGVVADKKAPSKSKE